MTAQASPGEGCEQRPFFDLRPVGAILHPSDRGDTAGPGQLVLVPVTFKAACEFIARHHRHNGPPTGWKFGCGVASAGELVGVVSAGRPVSREIQKREPRTLEVNRTCTDGTRNANSMLYGAIWRAARALGYDRCFTYIQGDEDGASLRAAGWVKVKEIPARGSWADHSQQLRDKRCPVGSGGVARVMWEIRTS